MYTVSTLKVQNIDTLSSYHHGNLREVLLNKGLELLESSPNASFSMRELTREIGVSANSVYRHFASKEELLTALAIQGFQKLLEAQALAIQNASNCEEGFITAGRQYIHFAVKNPMLFRLMYGRFVVSHDDANLKQFASLAYTGMLYAAAQALKFDVESREAKIVATKAWSVVHGLSHLIIDGQFDYLSSGEKEEMIEDVLNGLHSYKST